jgi:RNA polymerase sigma-70 factor (ECF subfamily)
MQREEHMGQGYHGGRLSQIATPWSDLDQAHGTMLPSLDAARRRLLQHYSSAVYSYLIGAVRDPNVADDLFQEFALRLMRGAFRGADPRRGRFRDFLKTALGHLVTDHYRRQRRVGLPYRGFPEPATSARPALAEAEERFAEEWRTRLIDRTFAALEAFEQRTGQPLHTLLHFRVENPELAVDDLARQLSDRLGQEPSAAWVYKHLHKARQKFAGLLVAEVARTLHCPGVQELGEELAELGLLQWCRPALDRLR